VHTSERAESRIQGTHEPHSLQIETCLPKVHTVQCFVRLHLLYRLKEATASAAFGDLEQFGTVGRRKMSSVSIEVSTRWLSRVKMLEDVLAVREHLPRILDKSKLAKYELVQRDWNAITALHAILKVCCASTLAGLMRRKLACFNRALRLLHCLRLHVMLVFCVLLQPANELVRLVEGDKMQSRLCLVPEGLHKIRAACLSLNTSK
jgi:hypothetical protein